MKSFAVRSPVTYKRKRAIIPISPPENRTERSMRLGKHALAWALCSAAAFGLSTLAKADDFYKGKNIKLIIGSGEASGVDILGRVAARYLSNHIPGKPTIIVQNMAARSPSLPPIT